MSRSVEVVHTPGSSYWFRMPVFWRERSVAGCCRAVTSYRLFEWIAYRHARLRVRRVIFPVFWFSRLLGTLMFLIFAGLSL